MTDQTSYESGPAPGPEGEDPFAQLAEVFAGRFALLLEDEPALSDHVAGRLLQAGFARVDCVDAGEAALAAALPAFFGGDGAALLEIESELAANSQVFRAFRDAVQGLQ